MRNTFGALGMRTKAMLMALCLSTPLITSAQVIKVSSPDTKLQVTITTNEAGKATYAVDYNGKEMLQSSPLGMSTNNTNFLDSLTLTSGASRTIDTTYTQSRIKASEIHYVANEQIATLTNPKGQKLDVQFRVSNNDVAFRYLLQIGRAHV